MAAAKLDLQGLSYSKQYDELFSQPTLNTRQRIPKPSLEAQAKEPGAKRIPFSDVWTTPKNGWVGREPWTFSDAVVGVAIAALHLICFAAPWTFSWFNLWLCVILYVAVGGLGICVSFHRQLTHRSFATPKWLEYTLAYLGTLGLEHDPIVWVQQHRYHHQNTDTPLDPHSTYEGFWFAHFGWLMHSKVLEARTADTWIVKDLLSDPFYRFLNRTYQLHAFGQYMVLYWLGGWGAVVWGGAVRQVAMWHVTWAVNSACHAWGYRPYNTGDLSTNCAWLSLLAFGESWHNTHHCFPYSARHGLEWWEVDLSWYFIRTLQFLGLAWDIRLPSEASKKKFSTSNPAAVTGMEEEEQLEGPTSAQQAQQGAARKED